MPKLPVVEPTRRPNVRRVALYLESVEAGGVEEHVRQLAVGLHSRGIQVSLICPGLPLTAPLCAAAREAEIDVHIPEALAGRDRLSRAAHWSELVVLLRRLQLDVLHIHLTGYRGGRIPLIAATLAWVPAKVCTAHLSPRHPQGLVARLERSAMNRLIGRWIAVSGVSREQQIYYLGQSASKTIAIPNGVDLDRYSRSVPGFARDQLGIPRTAQVIGCVARLSQQKGLPYLLQAFAHVRAEGVLDENVHLIIVGEGPMRGALEACARILGVQRLVHFTGYQADVPKFLNAMDAFVLPSLYEGMPIVLLEAMAAGIPVVATNVGGIGEVIEHGSNGLLVPSRDSDALAAAVLRLLRDNALSVRLATVAKSSVQDYASSRLVSRVLRAYQEARS